MSFAPGVVVAQRYELREKLGEGGMGVVWSATHTITGKSVALKFLKEPENRELVGRFIREARAVSVVRHPNIIEIHDVVTLSDGRPAMVMDLLEGESLACRLRRTRTLAWDELVSLMLPVFSAIDAAHSAGIIHRDLKPDNIFLSQLAGGRVEPIVFDFGICKVGPAESLFANAAALTETGMMMGTPAYMAPEQVYAEKDVDRRADVWALGVILYECATGMKPVDGDNLGQMLKAITSRRITPVERVAPQLPKRLSSLIDRMLTRDRDGRPASLREPIDTLRKLVQANNSGSELQSTTQPQGVTSVAKRLETRITASVVSPVTRSEPHSVAAKRAPSAFSVAVAAFTALGFAMGMLLLRSQSPTLAAVARSKPPSTPAASAAAIGDLPAAEVPCGAAIAFMIPTPSMSSAARKPKRARAPEAVAAAFQGFNTGRK